MAYQHALRRLYGISSTGIRLGLDRVRTALSELGDPHSSLTCVQVAGTNGKGAVAAYLAHGLRAAGLKTGLYTSPHLHRFSERIQIDGLEADTGLLGEQLTRVLDLVEGEPGIPLTFFEVATLAAFLHFSRCGVDVAVLEVGLGGRLDATSVVTPEVAAITSIGLDHTEYLGHDLGSIAEEKAHIAKAGVPLVVGSLPPEAQMRVEAIAVQKGAPLRILGRDFNVSEDLLPPLPGMHQKHNAAVAFEIYRLLGKRFNELENERFLAALPTAKWPGRFEIIEDGPRFILDGAHNMEATRALVDTLDSVDRQPDVLLFGGLLGKPVTQMLELLSQKAGATVLVPPPIDRALEPRHYAREQDKIAATVEQGVDLARELAGETGLILVTGSLFTVAEARRLLLGEAADPPIGL